MHQEWGDEGHWWLSASEPTVTLEPHLPGGNAVDCEPHEDRVSGPVTVLMVDDQPILAAGVGRHLELENGLRHVGSATTLHEGITLASKLQPDVVLLDQHLPDGQGDDHVGSFLRAAPATRVVILTAHPTADLYERCVEQGGSGLVSKYGRLGDLPTAIRNAHQGQLVKSLTPARSRPGPGFPVLFSERERQVLGLLARGMTNEAIADELGASVYSVRSHVRRLCSKLGAHSKLEALSLALRLRLVTVTDSDAAETVTERRRRSP